VLERVVSSFAGVGGFERSSWVLLDGVEPEDLRPNEKALLDDIRENFDVPLAGAAGGGAPFFGYSGFWLGSEDEVETALRCEELSVVETVFEFEVPLPLHSSQQLTDRSCGGE
jgi:hypothetical protein